MERPMPIVTDHTAILTGFSWWGGGVTNKPVFLTYSFNTDTPIPTGTYEQAFLDSFVPLTNNDRALARAALSQWADASGITFFEVPAGQGDLQFGRLNFDLSATYKGYGGFAQWFGSLDGDEFVGAITVNSIPSVFTDSVWMYMHEIGHILGFKHPRTGTVNLPANLDNRGQTVLGEIPPYANPATDPMVTGTLGPLDYPAVQLVYGAPGSDGSQIASWSWDAVNYVLTQSGGTGNDTIRGVHADDVIRGGSGQDIIRAYGGNDALYGEDGNDTVSAGSGNDKVYGGEGSDTLNGGSGFDIVSYENASSGVTVNLSLSIAQITGGAGTDTLMGFEAVVGSSFADALVGTHGDNRLTGGASDDTINGGNGNDTAIFSGHRNTYVISQNGQTVTIAGVDGTDTLTGIEFFQFGNTTYSLADALLPARRAPADVNGDGKSDLLWQNSDGQGATWLMDVTTLVVGSTVGVANRSWRIKGAGDFDGDGRADILWQHLDGRVGAMLAGASSVTEVGSNPGASWRVKGAGDLNGDGKADIVLQHENGQLAGWLMDGATFVGGSALGSGGAWQVRDSSDFNGDGKADLLLQHADGQTGLLLAGSSSITEVGSNPGTAWRVRGAGDFNGDGATDILLQHSSGQAATWLMSGTSLLWGATVGGVDATWQARGTSDQDGDGKADILWQNTNGQAGILLAGSSGITNVGNNPGATWRLKGAFDSEGVSDRRSPVHSDFNGDTRADLLWRNDDGQVAAWLMDGASLVAGRGIGSADASWQIRGKGDFNGDGKADILWQNTSGQTAIWTMSSFAMLAGTRVGGADPNWQVKGTGDFNGDGKADILLQHAGSGEVATWIMDGTSLLAGNVLGTVNGTWQVKGTDDFDGDGQDDILWQNTNGQAGIMLAGSSSVTAAGNNPGTAWTIRGAGDFNADGKADILWQANDGQIATWLMDGTAMLTGALVTTADPAWVAKSASDLDSDGRADILLQNTSGQAAIILAGISTILNAGNNPGTAWHVAAG
jgi:hypothetical protein